LEFRSQRHTECLWNQT